LRRCTTHSTCIHTYLYTHSYSHALTPSHPLFLIHSLSSPPSHPLSLIHSLSQTHSRPYPPLTPPLLHPPSYTPLSYPPLLPAPSPPSLLHSSFSRLRRRHFHRLARRRILRQEAEHVGCAPSRLAMRPSDEVHRQLSGRPDASAGVVFNWRVLQPCSHCSSWYAWPRYPHLLMLCVL
jgi:hypothetical protein